MIKKFVGGFFGVLVLFAMIGSCGNDSTPTSTKSTTTTTTRWTPPPPPTTTTTTTTTQTPVPTYEYNEYDNDDKVYVPDSKNRTGRSGHPCLPGERDGDNDGYCGEGK